MKLSFLLSLLLFSSNGWTEKTKIFLICDDQSQYLSGINYGPLTITIDLQKRVFSTNGIVNSGSAKLSFSEHETHYVARVEPTDYAIEYYSLNRISLELDFSFRKFINKTKKGELDKSSAPYWVDKKYQCKETERY